jgi:hypothetical protein
MIPVPLFDFKFLIPACGGLCRNLKSAALLKTLMANVHTAIPGESMLNCAAGLRQNMHHDERQMKKGGPRPSPFRPGVAASFRTLVTLPSLPVYLHTDRRHWR